MAQLFFTISFLYDIVPESLQVHLNAEIEMTTEHACIVRNIRRIDTAESPLLPELKLIKNNGQWLHTEGGRESNISKAVGRAIDLHQADGRGDGIPKKDKQ